MSQIGLGVMIHALGGDDGTAEAVQKSIGKVIREVSQNDDRLAISFEDRTTLVIEDAGQSCCESRYMTCDDDVTSFVGDTLTGVEVADGPNIESEYGDHEQQFLKVRTNRGVLTVCTHNEHNGYYGGFWMRARLS